jgi:branched-chain amino acid transport system ATP-binding protein
MITLEIKDIVTKYGNAVVLNGVSLKIKKGEVTVLLGSNGAGKTTLIKTIQGLLIPAKGTIFFNDRDISKMKAHQVRKLGISSAPEGRKIFPEMTVENNLRMGLFFMNLKEEKIRIKIDEMLDIFPILRERRQQLGGTLSGGEQGMLSFARALISDPQIMILDEPSLGIQPNIVKFLFEKIKQINSEKGISIILSEQNAKQSLKIADYCYLLQKGRIIDEGNAVEIAENSFVKRAYLESQ